MSRYVVAVVVCVWDWSCRAKDGSVERADLMQWWTFLATDTVGRLGFGESFGMLEKGEVRSFDGLDGRPVDRAAEN